MPTAAPPPESEPLHAQIRDRFLRRIAEGKLKPGDRLPSEAEIMKQFSVSRGTVTRAMRDLEVSGVLSRRRGSGTFVRDNGSAEAGHHLAMFVPWALEEQAIGHFQSQLHHSLASACADRHVLLSLQCLSRVGKSRREQLHNAARSLIARKPQVVLYCALELPHAEMDLNAEVLDQLVAGGIEVLLIDREIAAYPDRSAYTWISHDNRRGGAMLVKHLAARGYRRIAFVGIANDSSAVFDRLAGYHDGLRLCGMEADPSLVVRCASLRPEEADWDRVMAAEPDAVICKDAMFAARLGMSLTRRGVRIGPDVGLAGFDDDPIASLLPVPLTIIRQPIAPFVSAIYEAAMRAAHGVGGTSPASGKGDHIVIPTELVVRDSTRREPKRAHGTNDQ